MRKVSTVGPIFERATTTYEIRGGRIFPTLEMAEDHLLIERMTTLFQVCGGLTSETLTRSEIIDEIICWVVRNRNALHDYSQEIKQARIANE